MFYLYATSYTTSKNDSSTSILTDVHTDYTVLLATCSFARHCVHDHTRVLANTITSCYFYFSSCFVRCYRNLKEMASNLLSYDTLVHAVSGATVNIKIVFCTNVIFRYDRSFICITVSVTKVRVKTSNIGE